MTISVVIIEDQIEIRQMFAIMIKGNQGFKLLEEFENAEDAILRIPVLQPDVVLVDIHLPIKDGIYCVENLKPLCTKTQFLMCTSLENSDTIFAALKAGASGYISKTTSPSKIIDAIIDVYNGGSPMSSHIARKVVGSFQETQESNELKMLSTREKEILELLSKGLRYKEISERLFISTETVRTHIRNIYDKLQVNSRTMAVNKIYKR